MSNNIVTNSSSTYTGIVPNDTEMLPLDYVYDGPMYVIRASGGYSTARQFDTIQRLPEIIINQYDTTGAVNVLFDVRTFNSFIGIQKDMSNVNVTSSNFYDGDSDTLLIDSITLTAEQFVAGINASSVVSVGNLSSMYADFAEYVNAYFGLAGTVIVGNTAVGISTLYSSDYGFNPNGGVFDASAFMSIITASPDDGTGSYVTDLSGFITINNITQLLRNAVDANPFGNRSRATGTTASDVYDRANYGVTDGFMADDLFFLPKDGIQIQLKLLIQNAVIPPGTAAKAASKANAQDTSFASQSSENLPISGVTQDGIPMTNSVPGDTFIQTTSTVDTGIYRTLSAPLLIRLANLTTSTVTPFYASMGAVGTITATLNFSGTFDRVTVYRSDVSAAVVTDWTSASYTDTGLTPGTGYTYSVTYYVSGNASTFRGTLSATTTNPLANIVNVSVADISAFTVTTKSNNSITLAFAGTYDHVALYRGGYLLNSYVNQSPYTDGATVALTPNTPYTYTLDAFNSITATPDVVQRPTAPATTVYTLGVITGVTGTSVTTSEITLGYTGTFSYVYIYRGSTAIASNYAAVSYVDTGLVPNFPYNYRVVPYNATGDVGTGVYQSLTTEPSMNPVAVGVVTATTAKFLFTHNGTFNQPYFMYVGIRNGSSAVTTQNYDTSYTLTGLVADASYRFLVTPYNSNGVAGATQTVMVYTMASLNLAAFTAGPNTANAIQLNFAGSYNYVKLYRNGALVSTTAATSYVDSSLTPSTLYTYRLIPYNLLDVSAGFVDLSAQTLPTLTSLYTGIDTTTAVQVIFRGTYQYVSLVRTGSTGAQVTLRSQLNDTSYTDMALAADQEYSYTVTPYNAAGATGLPLTIQVYTAPLLTPGSVIIGGSGTTSYNNALVNYVLVRFDGSYNYVNVLRDGTLLANHVTGTSYFDYTVALNASYTYTIVPYTTRNANHYVVDSLGNTTYLTSDLSGTSASVTASSLPGINGVVQTTVSPSSVRLRFSGNYDYVTIERAEAGFPANLQVRDVSYLDTNLTTDYMYHYTLTPYTNAGVGGTPQLVVVYTAPTLTTLAVAGVHATSIDFTFDGSYQYVRLTRPGVTSAPIYGNQYTATGLTQNRTYTWTVTPYNPNDMSGTSLTTTVGTLSGITSVNAVSYTTTSIHFVLVGGYNTVAISRSDGAFDLTTADTSFTDTGLNVNTSYSYTATPYNAVGVSGEPVFFSAYTAPEIASDLLTLTATVNSVQFTYNQSTSYDYLTIRRDVSQLLLFTSPQGVYTFTDVSRNGNTTYSYVVTPYNASGVAGTSTHVSITTLPGLTSLGAGTLDSSSIQLLFTGFYNSMTLYVKDSVGSPTRTIYGVTDVSYTDPGLLSNTQYMYTVVPYSSVTHQNGPTSSISVYTLPGSMQLSAPVVTATFVQLNFSGNYSYVLVQRIGG